MDTAHSKATLSLSCHVGSVSNTDTNPGYFFNSSDLGNADHFIDMALDSQANILKGSASTSSPNLTLASTVTWSGVTWLL
jgi:hypothetical protein